MQNFGRVQTGRGGLGQGLVQRVVRRVRQHRVRVQPKAGKPVADGIGEQRVGASVRLGLAAAVAVSGGLAGRRRRGSSERFQRLAKLRDDHVFLAVVALQLPGEPGQHPVHRLGVRGRLAEGDALLLVLDLGARDEQVNAALVARQRGVEPVGGQARTVHQRVNHAEALGLVHGHRDAVAEASGRDVVGLQPLAHDAVLAALDLLSPLDQRAVLVVQLDHHAARPVVHVFAAGALPRLVVVAADQHDVTGRQGEGFAAGQPVLGLPAGELAQLAPDGPRGGVELVYVLVAGGQDQGVGNLLVQLLAGVADVLPGHQHGRHGLLPGLGDVHPPVVRVGPQSLPALVVAPHLQRAPLDGVALPVVGVEGVAADDFVDCSEPATDARALQLFGVADPHNFGSGEPRVGEQLG